MPAARNIRLGRQVDDVAARKRDELTSECHLSRVLSERSVRGGAQGESRAQAGVEADLGAPALEFSFTHPC